MYDNKRFAKDHLTSKIPIAYPEDTVRKIRANLIRNITKYETINYIYIVDKDNILIGVLSIKELYRARPDEKIKSRMIKKVIKSHMKEKRERVAIKSLKHNIKAVPVVDKKNRLLGVVPSDELLDILNEEATEDLLKIAGVPGHRKAEKTVVGLIKARFPWIFFGLIGGMISAFIINNFLGVIGSFLILVMYIPIIMNLSGSVANQAGIVYIRNTVLGNIKDRLKYVLKDAKVGLVMAGLIGLSVLFIEFLWHGDIRIGLIIGISQAIAITTGLFVGICIPILLEKVNLDPANGAGPLVTSTIDVISMLIYLTTATILISLLF